MEQTGATKTYKRKRYAPRIYNKEKQSLYSKRFKERYEVKLFQNVDIGPLKNILSLKDINGETWFVAAQIYKAICAKRFRQDAKRLSPFERELKLFCQLELPPMEKQTIISPMGIERPLVYERHPSIMKKTMFISENALSLIVLLFCDNEQIKQFFCDLKTPIRDVIICTNNVKNE